MENTRTRVGIGRIQNGVMTFMDATGKGFTKTISQPVVQQTTKEEVSMEKKEVVALNVPEFMKNRTKPKKTNVVMFPGVQQSSEKRTLRKDLKKIWNYLWEVK